MSETSAKKDHVAVRVDEKTLARLEAVRARMSPEWRRATQSDVLRAVIFAGLEVMERETPAPRKG